MARTYTREDARSARETIPADPYAVHRGEPQNATPYSPLYGAGGRFATLQEPGEWTRLDIATRAALADGSAIVSDGTADGTRVYPKVLDRWELADITGDPSLFDPRTTVDGWVWTV